MVEVHSSQHSWDLHFMKEAKLWMSRSKCLSRRIGSVLVQDNHVISTGYNGPPSGVPHCDYRDDNGQFTDHFVSSICPRQRMGFKSGEGLEYCTAVHSEINPLMQAAKMGVSTQGATLYAYCGTPCLNCMKELIQAGIARIVCLGKAGSSYAPLKDGDNPSKKDYNFPLSESLCEIAGVTLDVITEEEVDSD